MPFSDNTKLFPVCLDENACPTGKTFADWLDIAFRNSKTTVIHVPVTGGLYKYNLRVSGIYELQVKLNEWDGLNSVTTDYEAEKTNFINTLLQANITKADGDASKKEATWMLQARAAVTEKFEVTAGGEQLTQTNQVEISNKRCILFIHWQDWKERHENEYQKSTATLEQWLREDLELQTTINDIILAKVQKTESKFKRTAATNGKGAFALDHALTKAVRGYCEQYLMEELRALIVWALLGYSVVLHKQSINESMPLVMQKINKNHLLLGDSGQMRFQKLPAKIPKTEITTEKSVVPEDSSPREDGNISSSCTGSTSSSSSSAKEASAVVSPATIDKSALTQATFSLTESLEEKIISSSPKPTKRKRRKVLRQEDADAEVTVPVGKKSQKQIQNDGTKGLEKETVFEEFAESRSQVSGSRGHISKDSDFSSGSSGVVDPLTKTVVREVVQTYGIEGAVDLLDQWQKRKQKQKKSLAKATAISMTRKDGFFSEDQEKAGCFKRSHRNDEVENNRPSCTIL